MACDFFQAAYLVALKLRGTSIKDSEEDIALLIFLTALL